MTTTPSLNRLGAQGLRPPAGAMACALILFTLAALAVTDSETKSAKADSAESESESGGAGPARQWSGWPGGHRDRYSGTEAAARPGARCGSGVGATDITDDDGMPVMTVTRKLPPPARRARPGVRVSLSTGRVRVSLLATGTPSQAEAATVPVIVAGTDSDPGHHWQ